MKPIDILLLLIITACICSLMGCKDNAEPLAVMGGPAVLRSWSPQEECALAQTLAAYPADSVLWTLHDDWSRMRREIGVQPTPKNNKCKDTIDEVHLQS